MLTRERDNKTCICDRCACILNCPLVQINLSPIDIEFSLYSRQKKIKRPHIVCCCFFCVDTVSFYIHKNIQQFEFNIVRVARSLMSSFRRHGIFIMLLSVSEDRVVVVVVVIWCYIIRLSQLALFNKFTAGEPFFSHLYTLNNINIWNVFSKYSVFKFFSIYKLYNTLRNM